MRYAGFEFVSGRGGDMRSEKRITVYHSQEWECLVWAGWHTFTVDEPDQSGFRECVMVKQYDHLGRTV